MYWTVFFAILVGCLAVGFAACFVQNRRQRAEFVATLSPMERERLLDFEASKGDLQDSAIDASLG